VKAQAKRLTFVSLVLASLALAPLAAEPAKVAGQWNISLELGEITGRPTIDLKQDGEKLSGTYRGRYGASPIQGSVKDNQIEFTVTMAAEGQQTSGYFAGTVEGDKMSGTVEFEGAGEGTWVATRAPAQGK
jgi:hypothetical protein